MATSFAFQAVLVLNDAKGVPARKGDGNSGVLIKKGQGVIYFSLHVIEGVSKG
jgi:hypothetical protein